MSSVAVPPSGLPAFVDSLLDAELEKTTLSPADRGLLQELVFGAVRWQATLDWLIAQKTAGRQQRLALQVVLRLALYQMFWLDRIPDHAAVNESVTLAKNLGCGQQAGFVNAVLRGCLRERDALEKKLEELKQSLPALGYSHPDWLVERWRQRWGEEKLRRLLEWNNTPPKTYARVNLLRAEMKSLRELWVEEHVEVKLHPFDWAGNVLVYELVSHPPLTGLTSFKHGDFYVQDPSTLLAVRELDPKPGETILDFCAAPGGKTTLIAQFMQNQGRVMAHDITTERLELVKENCARLGVTCVETRCAGPDSVPFAADQFDRILVDAPCSNTGVLRRRVDLRWRIRPEEITRLREAQTAILNQVLPWLKPGGTLVYSTCSLEPEENGEVTRTFLDAHAEFQLVRERLLLPFEDGVDGAYVARLVRR
ncbi:MAG: 16S rRNA (cytosine(967)-C(5))-methyltransferase RsmB [Verrucomicrobia bacterium]|nr:16S rRNA (cytosine(967)-C(5))-methyltransferase RsmB [Verrucomicrobiota bacterium]